MDCINGTEYRRVDVAGDGRDAEGACCAACSSEGFDKCAGWNLKEDVCSLMALPIVIFDDGQKLGHCKAAQVRVGATADGNCWYDDPEYNVTFANVCDRKVCGCQAVSAMAVGREQHAMCHHHRSSARHRRPMSVSIPSRSDNRRPPTSVAAPASGSISSPSRPLSALFWQCAAALYDDFHHLIGTDGCAVAAQNPPAASALGKLDCPLTMLKVLCTPDSEFCSAAVDFECGQLRPVDGPGKGTYNTGQCRECAFKGSGARSGDGVATTLMNGHCNASLVNKACGGGNDSGFGLHGKWIEDLEMFACMMNGTWYSTQAAGQCKAGARPDGSGDCWWRLAETKRTVNQSCVDDRVIKSVQKHGAPCFGKCPGDTGTNRTQPCFIDCLFDTVLGNRTRSATDLCSELSGWEEGCANLARLSSLR